MANRRKTPDERIAELKQQEAQIRVRLARETAKLRDQERKDDTRRKIIVGALALEHQDGEFQATLTRLLHQYVKASDRRLFDLPPLSDPETSPRS